MSELDPALTRGRLLIGTRRYSSWSLRGWLAVRLAGLAIDEIVLPLAAGPTSGVALCTPGAAVPALEHHGVWISDSLAIAEYCAELAPSLWPGDRLARARARTAVAAMHAGFGALRGALPMNLGRDDRPRVSGLEPAVRTDIARVASLWRDCRAWHGNGGPFLFGARFTLADVAFAPVASRFLSYRAAPDAAALAYCRAVRAHPLLAEWYEAAGREPAAWRLARYEDLD